MKLVVDLQAAQACNAHRGIGGYASALAEALLGIGDAHELVFVLNGSFGEEFDRVALDLRAVDPDVTIEVWYPPRDLGGAREADAWTVRAAERIREEFVESLRPDAILVMSLFEGFVDAAVTSVHTTGRTPTAVVLYDLIPLARRRDYLADPTMEAWYETKIGHLRRADLLLAISDASRLEAIELLDLPEETVVDIGAAVRPMFRPGTVPGPTERRLRERYGLSRPFLMYTGGIDVRKNIDGLIEAFSLLPDNLRAKNQLAIVCSVDDGSREALQRRCEQLGLAADDVVLTGYVSDDDLLSLYRLCEASVFPSLHEGFGLPALEAMSCGRAVIASNCSSLPEVVGNVDALFDPTSVQSMATKMAQVLQDDEFRQELARRGLEQSKKFSWAITAERAVQGLEQVLHARSLLQSMVGRNAVRIERPRLAFLTPLPPEQSGISDYSALLLPRLADYYDIDVICDLQRSTDPKVAANCTIRSIAWFRRHHARYDRIVYQMGNSSFHAHMFDLIEQIPGVVVLHDFALSGIVAHQDALGQSSRPWLTELYFSHGYRALIDQRDADTLSDVVWQFPVNLRVLQRALGVIVHSDVARQLASRWYGPGSAAGWETIPMPRSAGGLLLRSAARDRLGIPADQIVVASFGNIGPTKLSDRLVRAWNRSRLSNDPSCRLVLVGDSHDPAFDATLRQIIDSDASRNVLITGRVDAGTYTTYLAAADIGVQLRTRSRGETSASAWDCLAHGLATIVNANGALIELPADSVLRVPDEFTDDELTVALETLRDDAGLRRTLGDRARAHTAQHHTPRIVAEAMVDHIEHFWRAPLNRQTRATTGLAEISPAAQESAALVDAAVSLARSVRVTPRPRQFFVDVSELNVRDAGSGIQRVTRNVVAELLNAPPSGYRVEPVAAGMHTEFRYARRFTSHLLGVQTHLDDNAIEFGPGDVFLGLDLQPLVVPSHRESFRRMRRSGVRVAFVVYDLLPILIPQHFYDGAAQMYERWLATAREADQLIAISQSVQLDVDRWLAEHPSSGHRPGLSFFHLGAHLERRNATTPVDELVEDAGRDPSTAFLMVGTIEPRKRHAQVLDAFERLWASDREIDLVIAGRVGWMVDDFIERLRTHPELGHRLHWIEDASDDRLEALYGSSAALIAASDAEGFGLPLIEASKFGLPIIARDIEVFREVAGDHATYFVGDQPEHLASALDQWLEVRRRGQSPNSALIPSLTWAQSAAQLVDALFAGTTDRLS